MHGEMDEDSSEPSLHSSDSDSDPDSAQGRRCESIAENVLIHGVRPRMAMRGRSRYEGSVISGTENSFRRSLSPVRNPNHLSLSGVLQGALDIDELLSDDSTEDDDDDDDDSSSDSHHALYLAASQQRLMMEAAFQRHSAEADTQVEPSSPESQNQEEQKRRMSVEVTTPRRMSVESITSVTTEKKENEEKAIKSPNHLRLLKFPKAKHAILSTMKKPASFKMHGILKEKKNDLKGRINKKTLLVVGFILLGIAGIVLTTVLIIVFGKTVGSGNAKDVSTSFLRSSLDRP